MPTRATRALVLLSCLELVGAWPPSRLAAQGGAASPVAPDSSRLVGAFYPSPSAQRKGWLRLAGWTARMEAAERERVGSAPALLVLLTVRDSTLAEGERQYAYFDLRRSRDIRDAEAAAWLDSVDRVTGEAAAASSAVVSALPEATLSRWLVQSSALSRYAFALREDRRSSSRLPSREDKLVRTVAPLLTDWQSDLYQLLIDRTDFGEVRRGERSLDVWRQRGAIASDSDRSVRQEGFERLRAGFARSRDLFAFALIAAVKGRQQLALLQGEPSAPAQVYRSRYLEESSVRTLLDGIRGRAGMLRQYARDRAEFVQRVGGYPDLRPWDLNAPVGMVTPRFPLDTARSLMREALRPLGPEYSAELDSLLDSAAGRLDVASGPHRADGGHSVGFPGTPVGVYLFGYDGLYADLGRLVHESAHAMQKRLMARGGVLPTYANGPNYLAESVALFNELVVADYLASTRGSDPRARQFYLERFLAKAFEVVLGAQDADSSRRSTTPSRPAGLRPRTTWTPSRIGS